MEKFLSFDYCTLATGSSVISSLKAAEKVIAKRGYRGTVDLYRVTTDRKQNLPCWVCRYGSNSLKHILPVFRKEAPLSVEQRCSIQKMKPNELFCYGESFFRTYNNRAGELCIRSVLIFPDENLVRTACRAKGYKVTRVAPVKILDARTNEYLTAAWCIKCRDCDTDFAVTFMDLRAGIKLEGFNLVEDAVYKDIAEGEIFTIGNAVYRARRNHDDGQWFITKYLT